MRLALVQFVLLSLSEGPGILESLLATNCVWPEVAGRVILPIEELRRPPIWEPDFVATHTFRHGLVPDDADAVHGPP